jgi:hypothetical protein
VFPQKPLLASSLSLNNALLLLLPGEIFVEYQLHAQALRPSSFVATAAYSDNGLWYVPTASEYPKGGYEVGVTFAADRDAGGEKLGCESLEREFLRGIGELVGREPGAAAAQASLWGCVGVPLASL